MTGPAAPATPSAPVELQVSGRGGVPATGASAVVLNVTVTEPVGGGFVTVWPAGSARPRASNLNFTSGLTVPNLVTVKLGAGGRVSLYHSGLAAHLVADVAGWFGETSGARYHPVVPARVLADPAGGGFLTVWPAGQPRPLASNLNFVASRTVPNLVVAKLGAAGR